MTPGLRTEDAKSPKVSPTAIDYAAAVDPDFEHGGEMEGCR